jgi:pyruvate kinase
MIEAGMNVARLNFAHGELDEHAAMIPEIRRATQAARRPGRDPGRTTAR